MLRRLYDWTLSLAAHPQALWVLFFIAFIEASIFPIPADVLLIAMVLATPTKAWRIAAVCTAGSVLGGFAGYAIGYALYETVGQRIIAFYGYEQEFEALREQYREYGFWIVMGKGLTPIPYKLVTIASGAFSMNPVEFGVASLITRAARFYLVAALLWKFGAPIKIFIEKYLNWLALLFLVLLIGGFLVVKWLL
jgi:membrane protein YqaA with SNARE-associated domain